MVEYLLTLLMLMWEFFKAGLFAIGGGLATIPFIYDIAARYSWLDAAIVPDMIAIGESTPGPIGVNIATYAGYNAAGAVLATLALVFPSMVVIILVSKVLKKFAENRFVDGVFYTIRPAVTAMIAAAGWTVLSTSVIDLSAVSAGWSFENLLAMFHPVALVLFAAAFAASKIWKKLHPIALIAAGAAVGIIFKM